MGTFVAKRVKMLETVSGKDGGQVPVIAYEKDKEYTINTEFLYNVFVKENKFAEDVEAPEAAPTDLSSLKFKELKKMASDKGINLPPSAGKEEYIKALNESEGFDSLSN